MQNLFMLLTSFDQHKVLSLELLKFWTTFSALQNSFVFSKRIFGRSSSFAELSQTDSGSFHGTKLEPFYERVFFVVIVVVCIVVIVVVVVVFIVVIVVVVKVNTSTQNASKLIGIRQRGSSYAVRVLADRRGGLPRSAFDTERTTASARQTCGAPEIRLLHKLASVAIV